MRRDDVEQVVPVLRVKFWPLNGLSSGHLPAVGHVCSPPFAPLVPASPREPRVGGFLYHKLHNFELLNRLRSWILSTSCHAARRLIVAAAESSGTPTSDWKRRKLSRVSDSAKESNISTTVALPAEYNGHWLGPATPRADPCLPSGTPELQLRRVNCFFRCEASSAEGVQC